MLGDLLSGKSLINILFELLQKLFFGIVSLYDEKSSKKGNNTVSIFSLLYLIVLEISEDIVFIINWENKYLLLNNINDTQIKYLKYIN